MLNDSSSLLHESAQNRIGFANKDKDPTTFHMVSSLKRATWYLHFFV